MSTQYAVGFRKRRQLALRSVAGLLLWLAAVIGLLAVAAQQAVFLSAATCVLGLACVMRDVAHLDRGRVEPITFFALSLCIVSLANTFGFSSLGSAGETSPYALYADARFFFLASALLSVGGIATILGYRFATSFGGLPIITAPLPTVHGRMNGALLIPVGIAISALGMAITFLPSESSLGTIGSLVRLGPNLVVFALARAGFARRHGRIVIVALLIALVESIRAALFDYLRSDLLVPLFAFTVAAVVGSRRLRILRTRPLLPIYAIALVFGAYFAVLGQVRTTGSTGPERVADLMNIQRQVAGDADSEAGLMVRLTNLNQLSQIGRLVHEGGYLRGQTLAYLGFAFIPRFLWLDKPTIAKGQWFAFRIGMAVERPDGSYTNSINMTVPGELYLNFGWFGVVLGCVGLGALLGLLWSRTAFWRDDQNILGSAFGFYLLWTAFGSGADVQIVVTLIAMYLLFVVATAIGMVLRRQRVTRSTRPLPPFGQQLAPP